MAARFQQMGLKQSTFRPSNASTAETSSACLVAPATGPAAGEAETRRSARESENSLTAKEKIAIQPAIRNNKSARRGRVRNILAALEKSPAINLMMPEDSKAKLS